MAGDASLADHATLALSSQVATAESRRSCDHNRAPGCQAYSCEELGVAVADARVLELVPRGEGQHLGC